MLRIDPASSVPPYEQLRMQVLERVGNGELAAGAKLPTVRKLAQDLGLAVNTVARAYRELDASGIIETRGRAGSFVAAQGDVLEQKGQAAAREFADTIRRLGIEPDAALSWAASALRS